MKGIISEVIIIAIVLTTSVVVVMNTNSILDEAEVKNSVNDAKQVIKTVDSAVSQIMLESTGARRSIDLTLTKGKFIFSGSDDTIKIRLEDTGLLKPGTRIQEENIILQGGGTLSSYEGDILSDGQTDLVLENSAVLLAVKKLGNATEQATINTSSIVAQIRNKRQGINYNNPRTGLFINDVDNTSVGTGYTELQLQSPNLQQNSIILHLNSSANISYDAVFTMSAATDFIELSVRNIKGV